MMLRSAMLIGLLLVPATNGIAQNKDARAAIFKSETPSSSRSSTARDYIKEAKAAK